MTEEAANKVRSIIDKLDEYRGFLKEYDICNHKTIAVKRDFLSSLGDTLNFSYDKDFDDMIRKYMVQKIAYLEKLLEEL